MKQAYRVAVGKEGARVGIIVRAEHPQAAVARVRWAARAALHRGHVDGRWSAPEASEPAAPLWADAALESSARVFRWGDGDPLTLAWSLLGVSVVIEGKPTDAPARLAALLAQHPDPQLVDETAEV